jgi:hypothetical protein
MGAFDEMTAAAGGAMATGGGGGFRVELALAEGTFHGGVGRVQGSGFGKMEWRSEFRIQNSGSRSWK